MKSRIDDSSVPRPFLTFQTHNALFNQLPLKGIRRKKFIVPKLAGHYLLDKLRMGNIQPGC